MKESITVNPYVIIVGNLFLLSMDKTLRKKEKEHRVENILIHLMLVETETPILKNRMIQEWITTGLVMDWANHDTDTDAYDAPPFAQTKGMEFSLSLLSSIAYEIEGDKTCRSSITIDYLAMMNHLRKIMYLVNGTSVDRARYPGSYYDASALEAKVRFNIMEVILDGYSAMSSVV